MNFEKNLKFIFEKMKCYSAYDSIQMLPVYDNNKKLVGFLKPITMLYSKIDPQIPSLFTRWRIENPTLSTGKFQPTEERTKTWLDQHILQRLDRLLFTIEDLNHEILGHIGFSNFRMAESIGEVDSVCRGVSGKIPGLMSFAMNTLIHWGFRELKMKKIELSVYDDNIHAIEFYKKLNFNITIKKPLYKTVVSGEEKLEIAPEGFSGKIEKYYLVMTYQGDIK